MPHCIDLCTSNAYMQYPLKVGFVYWIHTASDVWHTDLPSTATLLTPQVTIVTINTVTEQQLWLVLTRPEGYNSVKFILKYDCGVRGIPIELDYRSVEISGSSDVVVRRNRSCFVVGEISRVTVWFVSGTPISSTPAVDNATSGEGETRGAMCMYIF